ncbi:MAG: ABC transporter substrate-binding protein [Hyphomicrobiales bacterium]
MSSRVAMLLVTTALIGGGIARSIAAEPLAAEVVNIWTGAGERAAKQVLADRFNAAGGKFIDTAVACNTCAVSTTLNRILAGDPPTATQYAITTDPVDLINKGLLADIDDVATAGHWRDVLPRAVLDGITFNGKVYLVPLDSSAPNWMFYNIAVLKKAGIEQAPTNFDAAFFTALDKVKAAGFIPVAIGSNGAQYLWIFEAVMAGLGGKEHWQAVWAKHDAAALNGPLQRSIFDTFRRLGTYTDQGSSGRAWNPTVNLVISGQAGFAIMGDWAKGEFEAAGQTPGKEFGCLLPGKIPMFVMNGDVFGFPTQTKPEAIKAQKLLAKVVFEPDVQIDFTIKKGAIPARNDIDVAKTGRFDECSQKASEAYRNDAGVVGNVKIFLSPDQSGSLADLLAEYFNTPGMSTEEAVGRFASIITNR